MATTGMVADLVENVAKDHVEVTRQIPVEKLVSPPEFAGHYDPHAAITRYSRIKEDTALGLVLTVFFGAGIVLLTFIQKTPRGNQSGLDKFLSGQAAALVGSDVR